MLENMVKATGSVGDDVDITTGEKQQSPEVDRWVVCPISNGMGRNRIKTQMGLNRCMDT